jgi:3-keto-5-aminohexanoate cleavage enzyme
MSPDKLIITCAVVGAELTREIYPDLPITPKEIAKSACKAVSAGASIIHLHVRDEQGQPSQRVDIFEEVTQRIKNHCDCIVQYSTGGAVGTSVEERCAPLALKPEMATLSMGTLNFGDEIFENTKSTICAISESIQKNGVMAELEIFDAGMLDSVESYIQNKFIPEKFHIDFVLGVPGGMAGTLRNLNFLVEGLKADQSWSVAGMGRYQLPLTTHAIAMGGHVRVGLEDNYYFRKGEPAKSNAQFVKRVVEIAKSLERPVATVPEARKILGL